MNVVSLFAGIGGFDLAAERAGMTTTAQVEIDRHARTVLARHWPDVPRFEDVTDVKGTDLPDRVDVLAGGFPCQDYSVAGQRAGLAGDRGAVWWQFHRLIAETRPTWVVGENVPGLLSSNDGRDFGAIVGSLVELGYGVCWRVLDAQYFGVAQRRRRVFIVGHSGGVPRPEILFESESCDGDSPPRRETGSRVAALTANGVGAGGGPDDNAAQAGHLIAFPWQATAERKAYTDDGTTPTLPAAQTLAVAYQQHGTNVGPLGTLKGDGSLGSGVPFVASVAVRGRADGQEWELGDPELANSLRAGDGGSSRGNWMTDTATVRRLTPTECERLQGFPDGWTAAGQSDTQRYRQLGNAVAVPVVEWIMRRIANS